MMVIKRLVLYLDYACNNNCTFCPVSGQASLSERDAQELLRTAKNEGFTSVDFAGGEPTMRKELPMLMMFAKQIGYDSVGLWTNARILCYTDLACKLVDSGLSSVKVGIHGHNEALHDCITQANGSFSQSLDGLKNLKRGDPEIDVEIYSVMTEANSGFLREIVRLGISLDAGKCTFCYPAPSGNALAKRIMPSLKSLSPGICAAAKVGTELGMSVLFHGIPKCYMPVVGANDEKRFSGRFRFYHTDPVSQSIRPGDSPHACGMQKGPQCGSCKHNKICSGVFVKYAERWGLGELVPV